MRCEFPCPPPRPRNPAGVPARHVRSAGSWTLTSCRSPRRGGGCPQVTLQLRNEEAATARYKGFAMTTEWRLEGLTGEPLDGTSRRAPEVGLGPEQVVASQLQHLRDSDIERVYNFASPRNKKAVGNLSNFGEIVSSPPYGMVRNRLPRRSLPPSSRSMARDLDALLRRGPED